MLGRRSRADFWKQALVQAIQQDRLPAGTTLECSPWWRPGNSFVRSDPDVETDMDESGAAVKLKEEPQSKIEHVHEGANSDQTCHQRGCVSAFCLTVCVLLSRVDIFSALNFFQCSSSIEFSPCLAPQSRDLTSHAGVFQRNVNTRVDAVREALNMKARLSLSVCLCLALTLQSQFANASFFFALELICNCDCEFLLFRN